MLEVRAKDSTKGNNAQPNGMRYGRIHHTIISHVHAKWFICAIYLPFSPGYRERTQRERQTQLHMTVSTCCLIENRAHYFCECVFLCTRKSIKQNTQKQTHRNKRRDDKTHNSEVCERMRATHSRQIYGIHTGNEQSNICNTLTL